MSAPSTPDVQSLVRARGYASLWDYLCAHPAVPLVRVARELGGPSAAVLEDIAIRDALSRRQASLLVRDLAAREIHRSLPDGWKIQGDDKHAPYLSFGPRREPYKRLRNALLKQLTNAPPPPGWLPSTPEDPLLCSAYDAAQSSLSELDQALIARGEMLPDRGDLCAAAAALCNANIYESGASFLRDFLKAPRAAGLLFAARWCVSEAQNGGISQLFGNSTGVLVPEGVEGFLAVGMPKAAHALRSAMLLLGKTYPRDRAERQRALATLPKRKAKELGVYCEAFGTELDDEAGGFRDAADAYASRQVFATVWDDLRAFPGLPVHEVVERLGNGLPPTATIVLVVQQALQRREVSALVRDLVVRGIRAELPGGWGAGSDAQRALPFFIAGLDREPYRGLLKAMRARLQEEPPPHDWLPNTPEDPRLVVAYERGLATLSKDHQDLIGRGEIGS